MKVQLVGVSQCLSALKNVSDAVKRKYVRMALNAAGGQVKNAAVSRAPVRTKLLKQALGVKVTQRKATGEWYVVVGVKRGMSRAVRVTSAGKTRAMSKRATSNLRFTPGGGTVKKISPSRYLHLAEKGTRAHFVSVKNKKVLSSGGQVYGRRAAIRARPSRFMAAAAQVAGPQAISKAVVKLKELVEAHNNK